MTAMMMMRTSIPLEEQLSAYLELVGLLTVQYVMAIVV